MLGGSFFNGKGLWSCCPPRSAASWREFLRGKRSADHFFFRQAGRGCRADQSPPMPRASLPLLCVGLAFQRFGVSLERSMPAGHAALAIMPFIACLAMPTLPMLPIFFHHVAHRRCIFHGLFKFGPLPIARAFSDCVFFTAGLK